MREEIGPYLSSLEEELGIEIVGAWDTGSRARGLQTADSDYDISLCFTQPKSNYLIKEDYIESIDNDADEFISEPSDTDISIDLVEFNGWDVKKFFDLILEYKYTAFDCLVSPIQYKQHPAFNACSEYCIENIHPIEVYNRFQSAVGYNYEKYLQKASDPTVKRNLFIFECILRARYVQETHEYPPINYFVLLEKAPEAVFKEFSREEAEDLAQRKLDGEGDEKIGNPFSDQIEDFLEFELDYESHIPDNKIQSDELNEYIRLILE